MSQFDSFDRDTQNEIWDALEARENERAAIERADEERIRHATYVAARDLAGLAVQTVNEAEHYADWLTRHGENGTMRRV